MQFPHVPISMATTEWNDTSTWRYLRPQYVERIPACQHSCPTSNNIEMWIRLLEKGKINEAWEAATLENPFPAIMGRVCFHPCMDGCSRREFGGPVGINMLERALGDAAYNRPLPAKPLLPHSGKKVAIVGSGPAGLACAYHLTRLGHKVTVFESASRAGGMLRYGIPSYRLPRSVLDREILQLKEMGISFETGKAISDASNLQEVRQKFAAVFLGIGRQKSKLMGIPEEKSAGVMSGLEFLRRVAEGERPDIGKKALVVGGGNTAIDTARVARRLGAEATIVYRRSRAEMPAFEEEIKLAEEEGVKFETLVSPCRVVTGANGVAGMECRKMRLGEPDASGRRRPEPIDGSLITFDADSIMSAIGEEIDASFIPSSLPIEHGSIKTGPGGRTEWQNVFAGGDCISQTRTVVDALGAGKRSAIAIDCFLCGLSFDSIFEKIRVAETDAVFMSSYLEIKTGAPRLTSTTSESECQNRVANFSDLNPAYFTRSESNAYPTSTTSERFEGAGFSEVHLPPPDKIKNDELARCFHCGRCTECDNCYIYCPDVAIAKREGGFEVDYHFCKGCGVCAKECPRSALEMIEEPVEI